MKKIKLILIGLFCCAFHAQAQCVDNICNTMTYFFVDNSSGYKADALNEDMIEELKSRLKTVSAKSENYFLFYGTDAEDPKNSSDINSFVSGSKLKSYLNNESKESDNLNDLKMLRQFVIDDKLKVRKSVDIYLFLSSYAAKRMLKKPYEMPPALVFSRELPIYLTDKQIESKINLFINKEIASEFSEKQITDFFNFCNKQLNITTTQLQVKLL